MEFLEKHCKRFAEGNSGQGDLLKSERKNRELLSKKPSKDHKIPLTGQNSELKRDIKSEERQRELVSEEPRGKHVPLQFGQKTVEEE